MVRGLGIRISDRSRTCPLKQLNLSKTSMSVLAGPRRASQPFCCFSVAGHSRAQNRPRATPRLPAVTVAEVIHRPLREWQEFSGRLPGRGIRWKSIRRVSGFIDRVAFTDGVRVKKGPTFVPDRSRRPFSKRKSSALVAERTRTVFGPRSRQGPTARARRAAESVRTPIFHERSTSGRWRPNLQPRAPWVSIDASLQEARFEIANSRKCARRSTVTYRAPSSPAGNLVDQLPIFLTTLVSDDPVYVYFDADEQTYLRLREGEA